MVSLSDSLSAPPLTRRPLRVGFVPLVDSAPLAVASAEGLFEKHGVRVRLCPEPGWASIREKLIYNEIDAAACLAGLALALHYGLGCLSQPLVVPLVLNANGNGITLSKMIPSEVLQHPGGLKDHFATQRPDRPFTLATVLPYSSHYILLCDWLVRQGFKPGQNAEIVFLPPSVIPRNLATGAIDGYCVGEPWNSFAVMEGTGWCAATSLDLAKGHPEKVLAVCDGVYRERAAEVHALTTALLEACRLCEEPAYRGELCALLSRPEWLDLPEAMLGNSLSSPFQTGQGNSRHLPGLHLFFGDGINAPTTDKANWIISGMRQAGQLEGVRFSGLTSLFRSDLYEAAHGALPAPGSLPKAGTPLPTPSAKTS